MAEWIGCLAGGLGMSPFYSQELFTCECGLVFGLDSAFIEEEDDIFYECPKCREEIDIDRVIWEAHKKYGDPQGGEYDDEDN